MYEWMDGDDGDDSPLNLILASKLHAGRKQDIGLELMDMSLFSPGKKITPTTCALKICIF